MHPGVHRHEDLVGPRAVALTTSNLGAIETAVRGADLAALARADGHFAVTAREGNTVRMARTIGLPLRYFVAKLFHGPFLVVSDRIDALHAWCEKERIAWQFDPFYTRMVPAHHLVEVEQIGCPDPSPVYRRFFTPPAADDAATVEELGAAYAREALESLRGWLGTIPAGAPIALAFSGGIDSTAVFLLARKALADLGRDPDQLFAYTLDLGGGADAAQAEAAMAELGCLAQWKALRPRETELDLEGAIAVIEDYRPLDVECAAASLALLGEIRRVRPEIRHLLDGDGGDEDWKSYPLEDSDLTISSVLKNPLLYHEGWGVDALKHSPTYTGGLSRSYVRTFAPARAREFEAFSPFATRGCIAASSRASFERLAGGEEENLLALKGLATAAGVESVTGVRMPVNRKRRFQDGVSGEAHRRLRTSKAWCRQVFQEQWKGRLEAAWKTPARRRSGNEVPGPEGRVTARRG
jgi:asparagine synthase (glutamine-hydrolysing)